MNKYKIRIDSSSYKKIQRKLQKYNIKVGGMNIGDFLLANSFIDDSSDSPVTRVKRIILHIGGDFDSKPGNLENWLNLELNLLYGKNEYFLLRRRLDQLVKEYDRKAKISSVEVLDCRTVGDCIDLMDSKIPLVKRGR
jgi:hypothetical protein